MNHTPLQLFHKPMRCSWASGNMQPIDILSAARNVAGDCMGTLTHQIQWCSQGHA